MSVDTATTYVRKMVHRESHGPGDIDNALRRLEARYGLPFWSLWHLRKGRAKTVETGLFARIQGAYLDMCAKQVGALLHEIETESDSGASLEDLEAEAVALAQKIAAKRAKMRRAT